MRGRELREIASQEGLAGGGRRLARAPSRRRAQRGAGDRPAQATAQRDLDGPTERAVGTASRREEARGPQPGGVRDRTAREKMSASVRDVNSQPIPTASTPSVPTRPSATAARQRRRPRSPQWRPRVIRGVQVSGAGDRDRAAEDQAALAHGMMSAAAAHLSPNTAGMSWSATPESGASTATASRLVIAASLSTATPRSSPGSVQAEP